MSTPNRREALAAAALTVAASSGFTASARKETRIKAENELPGTTDWQPADRTGQRVASRRSPPTCWRSGAG